MIYYWIDILGTIAFAISGALSAMRKQMDIFGVIIIAFVTAIGGGTFRDLLIGVRPVTWLTTLTPSLLILGGAIIAIIFRSKLAHLSRSLFVFDTLGIGFFTIVGIEKAMAVGIHPALCIGLGTVSACFGGVTRDILCNEIPIIFRKEIYATACIAGGLTYLGLEQIPQIDEDYSTMTSILVVIAIRAYAVISGKSIPKLYRSLKDDET